MTDTHADQFALRPPLTLEAVVRPDGAVRLSAHGELDLASIDLLSGQLAAVEPTGAPVVLALAGLEFVDCAGLHALLMAVRDARRAGRTVTVERNVSRQFGRLLELTDTAESLWPANDAGQSDWFG